MSARTVASGNQTTATARQLARRLRAVGMGLGVLLGLLLLSGHAQGYEQRSGTLSLGVQGGAGMISSSDRFERGVTKIGYDSYDFAGGLGIRIRYGLDRSHAVGVSFEDLRFDRKAGEDRDLPSQYQLNNFMIDYYVYFHRRYKLSRYVVLGAGFHRPSFRFANDENILPGEGLTANFGGGMEYFLRRPFALDASVRGYYLRLKGGSAVAGELMLGVHYYLLN